MALQQSLLRSTPSASSADEWWDAHVNRPLAALMVDLVANTRVTPNQITTVAASFGLTAALLLVTGASSAVGWAGVLIYGYMILDCADGQLARKRGGGTFIGRLWDGFADWTVALAIHLGLIGYLSVHSMTIFGREMSGFALFLIAAAAGVSMGLHCMYYDLLKNRLRARAGEPSECDDPEDIQRRIDQSESSMLRFWLRIYHVYCSWQAHLRTKERIPLASPVELTREVAVLRRWGLIGPTMHLLVFAVAATLSTLSPWGFALYIGYSAIFANVVMVWLLARHRSS